MTQWLLFSTVAGRSDAQVYHLQLEVPRVVARALVLRVYGPQGAIKGSTVELDEGVLANASQDQAHIHFGGHFGFLVTVP